MKYSNNMITITVNANDTIYEVRKNGALLDRVCIHGKDMGDVAEQCREKALAGEYGAQYFKQMLICNEVGSMSARACKHIHSGNENAANILMGYVHETIKNSGMNKESLYRMVSCFASQYGVNISFLLGKPMISLF